MGNDLFDNIKAFVIEFSCISQKTHLDRDTLIESEVGLSGDDAMEFIIAFGKKFNVDVSNFMAAEYFEAEGDWILPAIFRFLTRTKKTKQKELKLGDLERAALAGRLDESIINKG